MDTNPLIIALISSYKEGPIIQGTIRSVLKATPYVIVYEGQTGEYKVDGPQTDPGKYRSHSQIDYTFGSWSSEHEKRSLMLHHAKNHTIVKRTRQLPWILTIDADEILVWGEYLPDWLAQLKPGYPESQENIVPIKRTEGGWRPDTVVTLKDYCFDEQVNSHKVVVRSSTGFETQIAPSRLVHASLVDSYLVSCWHILTPDGNTGFLDHRDSEREPFVGEPHIHHRHYMRRDDRKTLRASEGEEKEFLRDRRAYMAKHFPELPYKFHDGLDNES